MKVDKSQALIVLFGVFGAQIFNPPVRMKKNLFMDSTQ